MLLKHEGMPTYRFMVDPENPGFKQFMFTENETNTDGLYGHKAYTPYTKDAFHRYIVKKEKKAINPKNEGSKASALYQLNLEPQEEVILRFRLVREDQVSRVSFGGILQLRIQTLQKRV